jgi:hypothetical protein
MTLAKRMLVLVLIVVLSVQVFGCGVGSTPAENRRTAARVIDYDARMLVDDTALLIQLDRPRHASKCVID